GGRARGRRPARRLRKASRRAEPALPRRAVRARSQARRTAAREPYRGRSGAARRDGVFRRAGRRLAPLRLRQPPPRQRRNRTAHEEIQGSLRMKSWLPPFALLALCAAGVAWFLSTHERVPSREWVGPSAEARRNLYLAAGRFATRMGLATRELRSL